MPDVDMDKLSQIEKLTRLVSMEIGVGMKQRNMHGYGFLLMMFSFGGNEMTYVSSAQRSDMIKMLKEFLAKQELGIVDELGRRNRDKRNP